MKLSPVSSKSIGTSFDPQNEVTSLGRSIHDRLITMLNTIDHIGTSIALGEKGNLDAAHDYRIKGVIKNK